VGPHNICKDEKQGLGDIAELKTYCRSYGKAVRNIHRCGERLLVTNLVEVAHSLLTQFSVLDSRVNCQPYCSVAWG